MCFSATASFTVSGLLLFSAILAQMKARSREMQFFALIPFIFAIQQAAEGFLWYLGTGHPWHRAMAYIFLWGASLWPAFIPTSMWLLETRKERKNILGILAIVGILFFLSCLYYMYRYGITAQLGGDHIIYRFNHVGVNSYTWIRYIYVAILTLAPFISSVKNMWMFGVGVIGSFIVAHIWYAQHFTSIWCFFAAILSSMVLYIVMSE